MLCASPQSSEKASKIISLVAYLATLIQIEIGLNRVPKPITEQSLEIRSFRKIYFEIIKKRRLRGELIANHTYDMPINWHKRK